MALVAVQLTVFSFRHFRWLPIYRCSWSSTVSPYWPSGITATEITAWVYDDPEILFAVQYDNPSPNTGATVQTDVGEQCDWTVASPGGSTRTGLSDCKLTVIQTTSGQFQITGFEGTTGGVDSTLTDAFVVATVRINEHQYKAQPPLTRFKGVLNYGYSYA